MTVILPHIVHLRWTEALQDPNPFRWRSLAEMCGILSVKTDMETPGVPLVDDLKCLSDMAFGFYIECMPNV